MVASIVQQLPKGGKWTTEKRGKWLAAMTSAIDLLVEIELEYEPDTIGESSEFTGTI